MAVVCPPAWVRLPAYPRHAWNIRNFVPVPSGPSLVRTPLTPNTDCAPLCPRSGPCDQGPTRIFSYRELARSLAAAGGGPARCKRPQIRQLSGGRGGAFLPFVPFTERVVSFSRDPGQSGRPPCGVVGQGADDDRSGRGNGAGQRKPDMQVARDISYAQVSAPQPAAARDGSVMIRVNEMATGRLAPDSARPGLWTRRSGQGRGFLAGDLPALRAAAS